MLQGVRGGALRPWRVKGTRRKSVEVESNQLDGSCRFWGRLSAEWRFFRAGVFETRLSC